MLGLKKGAVHLTSYDKTWRLLFEKEKKVLIQALGDSVVSIEHIGSTAVAGMSAKPILDIDVGVQSTKDFKRLSMFVENLGYRQVKNKSAPHVHVVFAKGTAGKTTHYLHMMKYLGVTWNRDVRFRDILRTNKTLAKRYESLKKGLAKKFQNERMRYTDGKKNFILATVKKYEKIKKI